MVSTIADEGDHLGRIVTPISSTSPVIRLQNVQFQIESELAEDVTVLAGQV
jgi:hypothetical protein